MSQIGRNVWRLVRAALWRRPVRALPARGDDVDWGDRETRPEAEGGHQELGGGVRGEHGENGDSESRCQGEEQGGRLRCVRRGGQQGGQRRQVVGCLCLPYYRLSPNECLFIRSGTDETVPRLRIAINRSGLSFVMDHFVETHPVELILRDFIHVTYTHQISHPGKTFLRSIASFVCKDSLLFISHVIFACLFFAHKVATITSLQFFPSLPAHCNSTSPNSSQVSTMVSFHCQTHSPRLHSCDLHKSNLSSRRRHFYVRIKTFHCILCVCGFTSSKSISSFLLVLSSFTKLQSHPSNSPQVSPVIAILPPPIPFKSPNFSPNYFQVSPFLPQFFPSHIPIPFKSPHFSSILSKSPHFPQFFPSLPKSCLWLHCYHTTTSFHFDSLIAIPLKNLSHLNSTSRKNFPIVCEK